MENKITSKFNKRKILLKTAVEKKGLAANINNWNIPAGNVILREKGNYRFISLKEARKLFNEKKAKIHDIIGNFQINDENIIQKPKSINKKNVKDKYQSKIIQKVLTSEEKNDFYALYHFVKDNNIKGKGKLIITSNNQVLTDENIDINIEYRKWFNQTGIFIGLVNSEYHIWNKVNLTDIRHFSSGRAIKFKESKNKRLDKQYIKDWKNTIVKFIFIPDTKISAKKIVQTFRESSDTGTCFFDVIEEFLNNKRENVVKNKNYITKLNHLRNFKQEYNGAMYEENIKNICDKLNINVDIYDIIGNKFCEYKCEKGQPLTTIRFINNRLNHVEKYVDYHNKIIEKDECMKDIILLKLNNNEPFYYTGSIHNPSMIFSQDGTYKYINQINEIIKKFNKDINIHNFSLDILKDSETFEYLRNGVNYNAHCKFNKSSNDKKLFEPDLKKAYSQYKNSKWYMGFCNNMTHVVKLKNWTVKKCKEFLGYYTVKIHNIKNQNVKKILFEMGMKENKYYILSSPEIVFFNDKGVDFEILAGSYSFKRWDFDFTEDMLKKIDGKSVYAIWAGKLNSVNYQNEYKFFGNLEYAENLANFHENVYINSNFNTRWNPLLNEREVIDEDFDINNIESKIASDKKNVFYLGHIGGFITSYCRINVLEELFKIDFNKIYGYKLDGFVIDDETYIKKNYQCDEINTESYCKRWKLKPAKINFNWGENIFIEIDEKDELYFGKEYDGLFDKNVVFLSGPGGTGKSSFVLNNINDILFVSYMWRLTTEKMIEYNINGICFKKLIGDGCKSYLEENKNNLPKRIFIDEMTMNESISVKKIMKMYPYVQFFLAGDIDYNGDYYQCSSADVENVINPCEIKNMKFIQRTENFRVKDNILLERLNKLRKYMKKSNFDTYMITKYVEELFNDRMVDFQKSMYDYKNDWILVSVINGKKSQVDYYNNLCNGKKYKCIKHNSNDIYKKINGGEAYLNGEIITDPKEDLQTSKWKRQDAYTIHSVQGMTVKSPSKVFIDLNFIFCARQLYTALSRCENLHQIYLIRGEGEYPF